MTLQQQYNLITEGKGNKNFFMRQALRQFPNFLNVNNTFEQTTHILKSKNIISENISNVVSLQSNQSFTSNKTSYEKSFEKFLAEEVKAEMKETDKEIVDIEVKNYNYKDTKNIDNIYGQAFLSGYYVEMEDPKNAKKTVEELKSIVAKNLAKDITYYTTNSAFGLKIQGYVDDVPGAGKIVEPKGKHKSSGYGDLKEQKLRSIIHKSIKEIGMFNDPIGYEKGSKSRMEVARDILKDGGLSKEEIDTFIDDNMFKKGRIDDLAKKYINKSKINESLINEEISTAFLILMNAAIVNGILIGQMAASGGGGDFTPIEDLKNWWKKRKSDKALKSIIDKIKDDEDVVEFMKLTPSQQRGKFRSLIATKLTGDELEYLNRINRNHFQTESMDQHSLQESKHLNEAKQSILDYSNSKNKILVGLKTNLLRDMKERYDHKEDGDTIYFFDNNGRHFGTLFDMGTRYQELRHNGKLDDKGWLKENLANKVAVTENFPGPGETVDAKDLDNDMLDYFNRTNKVLSIDTKSKKGIKGSVGKMYGDLVFNGDSINKKDIVRVKILESKVNEGYGMSLEDAKAEAQRVSDEEGVVQHVEETEEGSGKYKVSDFYDSDLTVVSYENGFKM